MSQYRKNEIVSGLFITLAALVFGLFAFKVGRFDLMGLLKGEAISCRAFFRDVKTLQSGSKVRVGGRDVGEVLSLRLVERPAEGEAELLRLVNEVTFELTYPELRVDPKTAQVAVVQDSLLSPHFLELDPGRWPAEQTPPLLFDAGLAEGTVFASVEVTGLNEVMALARPAVEELSAILRNVNRRLLTAENLESVHRSLASLEGTLTEGHQLVTSLNRGILSPDNVAAIDRMVHNLDLTVADGRALAARLEALVDKEKDPRIDSVLTDVAAASAELRRSLEAISADLEQLLGRADDLIAVSEADLAESARRLRRALWQGEMALRKIRANPAVLLFGDDETDLEAHDLDLTEIRLRGRARPYEQRDERDEN